MEVPRKQLLAEFGDGMLQIGIAGPYEEADINSNRTNHLVNQLLLFRVSFVVSNSIDIGSAILIEGTGN